MNIAICDDEKFFRNTLKEKLRLYAEDRAMVFVFDEFSDGLSFIESKKQYDLIFMDYKMRDLNGIETIRILRENNQKAAIIFLSSYPNAVFESFEVSAFRFLTKPIEDKKLFRALDDYLKSFSGNDYLILNQKPKIVRISYDDIIYIEAKNKRSLIRVGEKIIVYPCILSELEIKLPANRFFRCHRSFIINLAHLKERKGYEIRLGNGEKATLSRSKVTEFKSKYSDYLKRYCFEVN
ncbi:MAG: LytTR family DNA-binding domain-containing protein [Oscillospiraceae bacterium]|nr:LytTR family DNA-binding domain-containing protein [Oscillospiraceae bacterium]